MNIRLIICGLCLFALDSCIILPNFDNESTHPEIIGFLVDSISNKPIINAIITEKNIDDTIVSESSGRFNFKAKNEFMAFKMIAMDPPLPYIYLKIEKSGYETKNVRLDYQKIQYNREKPDTIYLGIIKLINNAP